MSSPTSQIKTASIPEGHKVRSYKVAGKLRFIRSYTRPNGIKREVHLHVTKGFRDTRA